MQTYSLVPDADCSDPVLVVSAWHAWKPEVIISVCNSKKLYMYNIKVLNIIYSLFQDSFEFTDSHEIHLHNLL